jgi:hypothetical protein
MAQAPKNHQTRTESVGKWTIRIKSYQLGNAYVCTVDNVSPGAVIARSTGSTREEAETNGVAQAKAAIGD